MCIGTARLTHTTVPALAILAWVACSESDPQWAIEIARLDSWFGGGAALESKLLDTPLVLIEGEAAERRAFLAEWREVNDARALELARTTVDAELAAAAIEFFLTPAGTAFREAERLTLSLYPWVPEDFAVESAARFGDAAAVGDAASSALLEIAESGGSSSPMDVAMLRGAATIDPDHANGIRTFFESEHGKRWLAARRAIAPGVIARFREFSARARDRGIVRDALNLPGYLPKDRAR